MFHNRMAITASCIAVLGIWSMPRMAADEHDKNTFVTISAPVEIPGKVLLAGTYVFKLLDSSSNRNIVQIYDEDQKHLQATILTGPDYRLNRPDKPLILFEERPSGTPPAVKAWFYPYDNYGEEFVYVGPALVPVNQILGSVSSNSGAFDAGGGIKIPTVRRGPKIFIEARSVRGFTSNSKTTIAPISVGICF